MLQSIRDKAQNWIFTVIIFMLVLAFAFFGIERFFDGSVSDSVIAKVDGHKISQNAFNISYQRLRRQLELQMGDQFTLTPEIESNLKKQALDQIIHGYILTDAAMAQGFRVTNDQIDSVLLSIPMFQDNGQFSAARFQAVLNNLFYTEDSFLTQLQSDMLVNQEQVGLVTSAFALPNEVARAYALINQQRDFCYTIIPSSKFVGSIQVSDAGKKQFYQQNQTLFTTPEKVSISWVGLNMPDILNRQKFSQEQLKAYYEANEASFTLPERWHVAEILIRLPEHPTKQEKEAAEMRIKTIQQALNGKSDFAHVAEKYSDDIFTAKHGGVLPWFTASMTEPAVVRAVGKLKAGEISKPVKTKFGLSIYTLLAHTPKKVQPYDTVGKQVAERLAQEHAQKTFAAQSDELANMAFSDSNSLAGAAKALNLTIHQTPLFSKNGLKTGIASNSKVVNAAFSSTVLVQKYNSDPIQISPTSIVVIRVNQHTPATVKSYQEVESQITKLLTDRIAAADAKKLGIQIAAQIKTKFDLQKLASANGLEFKQAISVGRHSDSVPANILNQAFKAAPPVGTSSAPSVTGLALTMGDYAVVAVNEVENGNISYLQNMNGTVYRDQLAAQYGQLDYGLYARQQITGAKIKIYH